MSFHSWKRCAKFTPTHWKIHCWVPLFLMGIAHRVLVLTRAIRFLHQQTSFYLACRTYSEGITCAGTRGRNESHLFNTHEVPCPKECLCFPPFPVSRALSQALIVLSYNAFEKSLLKLWLLLKLIRHEPQPGESRDSFIIVILAETRRIPWPQGVQRTSSKRRR